jgi:hypothetical protein
MDFHHVKGRYVQKGITFGLTEYNAVILLYFNTGVGCHSAKQWIQLEITPQNKFTRIPL